MHDLPLPVDGAVPERLEQILTGQWGQFVQLRRVVLQQFGDEAIHDLRVASRRLRTALEAAAPCVDQDELRRIWRPIRKVTRELGHLRNLDEARSYFAGLRQAGLLPLLVTLDKQRRQERRRVKLLLEELPCKRLQRQLEQVVHRLRTGPGSEPSRVIGWLSERNQALYRPIHHLLQLPGLAGQAEERHTLRRAIKKWRYFYELLDRVCGRQQGELVCLLRQYQAVLGDLNDREVFQALLREAAELPAAVQREVASVLCRQHRVLVTSFKRLLQKQPLSYQFMV